MTYVTGFLTPVKSEDKARYVKSAQASWPLFQKYGALSQVETWGEDVPDGKPYQIVSVNDIPDDRSFRNAWTYEEA